MAPDTASTREQRELRVPLELLEEVREWGRGARDPDPAWAKLGITTGTGAPTDDVAARLAACLAEAEVDLEVSGLRPIEQICRGWISAEAFVLAVPADDGQYDILFDHVLCLPPRLARFLDLGPRPVSPALQTFCMPRQSLDRVLTLTPPFDEGAVAAAVGSDAGLTPDAVAKLVEIATSRAHWRVQVSWPSTGDRRGAAICEAIDSGDQGLWRVSDFSEAGIDLVAVQSATSTEIFRELSTLLPGDDELEGLSPAVDTDGAAP